MKFMKFSIYFSLSSDMNMQAYIFFFLSAKPVQPLSGSVNVEYNECALINGRLLFGIINGGMSQDA